MKRFLLVFSLLLNTIAFGQQVFYQDICNCGVTGAGFSTGMGSGSGSFDIHIEPGSVIKRAFIFVQRFGDAKDTIIQINNISYSFNSSNQVSADVIFPNTPVYSAIHAIDITNDIQSSQNTYDVTIPAQFENSFGVSYGNVYLYVIYEKSNLPISTFSIFLNNYDMTNYEQEYHTSDLNPIVTNFPVGFAIYTDRINAVDLHDGSYIYLNSNLLGLLKGTDQVNNLWEGAGVKGHFYYQDNQLYGLDDDFPNNTMGGSDGLADISVYLNNFATTLNWTLKWEGLNTYYNIYSGFFLTYTTPCDTFTTTVTQDTTICYGETLQLQATGGQSYEWTAVTDSALGLDALSCTDCPNPVFSGNSSQVYTVRIWNNDSCSVVKSVRVNVSNPQYIRCYTGETKCGASNGYIQAIDLPSDLTSWHVVSFNGDTLDSFIGNTLPNIEAGDYSVHYIDNFGCKSNDTIVTVEPYNNTVADFSVNPPSGMKPLEVFLENQSQNATDFEWFLNGVSTGTTPITFFDSSGVYEISLTAWELDPSCADTTSFTVIVFDSLVVTLPNVFTPNGDGVNDFFNIETNLPVVYELSILNRWGNVLFENKGKLTKGTHNLWNGKNKSGEPVTDGTYFYMISFLLDEDDVNCEVTDCEVRKNGFVQVFGK